MWHYHGASKSWFMVITRNLGIINSESLSGERLSCDLGIDNLSQFLKETIDTGRSQCTFDLDTT